LRHAKSLEHNDSRRIVKKKRAITMTSSPRSRSEHLDHQDAREAEVSKPPRSAMAAMSRFVAASTHVQRDADPSADALDDVIL
jgi:hypothetical protein